MKSEYWDIIAKHLANEELSAEEKEILDSLKSDDEMKKIINQSTEVIDQTTIYYDLKKFDTDKAWDKLDSQLAPGRKKITINLMLRVAAIFIMIVSTGVAIWQFGSKKHNSHEFATSQYDLSKPEIILPDGTKVTLNHSSKIGFPDEFIGNTREVTLSGEAFFEVTPNKQKPFIIKTNGASIKVLGTSFNVYAYNDVPTVEVIVKTGKVELLDNTVSEKNTVGKIFLLPGEKGVYNKTNRIISKEDTFNINNLSWITHEIKFNYTRLEEAINTLRRTYNLKVEIDPNVDQNLQLSATFTKQKPEYIIDVIALTLNLKLEKTSNNSYLIKNNN